MKKNTKKKIKNEKKDRFSEGCARLLYDICRLSGVVEDVRRKPVKPLEKLLEEYFPYSSMLKKKP